MLQFKRSADFKDVGNKLMLLKTGHLYGKGSQIDIDDSNENNEGIKLYKDWGKDNKGMRMPLYSDSSFDATPENRAVNYKHVFKVWAYQVKGALDEGCGDTPWGLTQRQMENIFPEFRARLKLYAKCCDQSGKIVKDFEYYKWYKKQDFAMKGTRGRKL